MINLFRKNKYLSVKFLETTDEGQTTIALLYYDKKLEQIFHLQLTQSNFSLDIKNVLAKGYFFNNKKICTKDKELFLENLCYHFTGSYLRCTKPLKLSISEIENLRADM